jgi:hypothetical protein
MKTLTTILAAAALLAVISLPAFADERQLSFEIVI